MAARGLDVKHLILVVNYDCPNHYEDYIHRCGRTGRAGNKGFAYTFITPDQQRASGDIIKAMELSETPVPTELQTLWDQYKTKLAAVTTGLNYEISKISFFYLLLCLNRKGKRSDLEVVGFPGKVLNLMNRKPWLCQKRKNSRKLL